MMQLDFTQHLARAEGGRDAEKLLTLAATVADELLDAHGEITVADVRIELGRRGLLANDGTEKLDALGALARRMGLVSTGQRRRSRLDVTHGNLGVVWTRRRVA